MSEMLLSEITGLRSKGDVVGFEIEVEFAGGLATGLEEINSGNVRIIEDHSLRGGYEFIARTPLSLLNAFKAIDRVCSFLSNRSVSLSPRTSTHFHLNMLDLTETQYLNVLLLSWYFEEFIQSNLLEHRKENNFCMTLRNSDEFVFTMVDHLKQGGSVAYMPATRDYSKYSATNIATLLGIGTIEFRSFHGCIDAKISKGWLRNLHSIKKFAISFETPESLFEYLFTNSFVEVASKALHTPTAFGNPKTFDDRLTNLFYISKIVDAFDISKNLTTKETLKKKKSRWGR